MKRLCLAVLLVIPAGCGGVRETRPAPDTRPAGPLPGGWRPVVGKGTGTLRGRVTYRGKRPDLKALTDELQAAMRQSKQDADCCLKGGPEEVSQQVWKIDDKGGVGNVFVWLRPPAKQYFVIDPRQKTWPDKVVIEVPHCTFLPHAVTAFPAYRDPKDPRQLVPTGQKVVVKNISPVSHDAKLERKQEVTALLPPGINPGAERPLFPDRLDRPARLCCNIHPWMLAWVGAFDHPFAAVTAADGTYEIRNVPAGTKLRVFAWHEEPGWLSPARAEGEELELKAGVNTKDYELRPPGRE